ncbi:MAG: ATPase, T2SS/T4P/T4SS family [Vicinamibacterales bacterium]
MVRADGDALVMHVGERPYVVVGSGTKDLSAQILNLEAMKGMLQQLLPAPAQDSLDEFGAVEHRLPPAGPDAFTVVAARGGDDIWIEIRRRRGTLVAAPAPASSPVAEPVERPEPPPVAAAVHEAIDAADDRGLAPVLQLTRTVRIEVPQRPATSRASGIERLLRLAAARAASALFVTSDSRPSIRVDGDVRPLDGEAAMSRAEVEAAVMELMPASAQEAVGRGEPTEWITDFGETGSVRCITFTDHRGPGVVFRLMATRAATAEQLGLSREVQALATEPQGLVLVAGAHGTGRSTLLSALVDQVNRQRAEYVVTLERQIRFVHDNRIATVSQREIRGGADEALAAARAALREDPDVLVVDDLASAQMVPLLLDAASETLVLVSITAPSATEAVERFIELAPASQRPGVQAAMAETFRGAVAQVLLKKSGGGRVAAREVLLATAAVSRAISDGIPGQLYVALEAGRKLGQVPLADAVAALVQSGAVDVREAFRKSPDRDRLLASLKREGIDTSAVERLA